MLDLKEHASTLVIRLPSEVMREVHPLLRNLVGTLSLNGRSMLVGYSATKIMMMEEDYWLLSLHYVGRLTSMSELHVRADYWPVIHLLWDEHLPLSEEDLRYAHG